MFTEPIFVMISQIETLPCFNDLWGWPTEFADTIACTNWHHGFSAFNMGAKCWQIYPLIIIAMPWLNADECQNTKNLLHPPIYLRYHLLGAMCLQFLVLLHYNTPQHFHSLWKSYTVRPSQNGTEYCSIFHSSAQMQNKYWSRSCWNCWQPSSMSMLLFYFSVIFIYWTFIKFILLPIVYRVYRPVMLLQLNLIVQFQHKWQLNIPGSLDCWFVNILIMHCTFSYRSFNNWWTQWAWHLSLWHITSQKTPVRKANFHCLFLHSTIKPITVRIQLARPPCIPYRQHAPPCHRQSC